MTIQVIAHLTRARCQLGDTQQKEATFRASRYAMVFTIVLYLMFNSSLVAQEARAPSKLLGEILQCVPNVTDTLMVMLDPFEADNDDSSSVSTCSMLRPWILGPLQEVQLNKLLETAKQKHVSVALEFAWSMEYPEDVGVGPYDGCHILLVRDAIQEDELISKIGQVAASTVIFDGARWHQVVLAGDRTCFVTLIRRHIIVVATNEAAARAMSPLLSQQATDVSRDLPDTDEIYGNHACFIWSRYVSPPETANSRIIQFVVDRQTKRHLLSVRGNMNENDTRLKGDLQQIVGNSLKITKAESMLTLSFDLRGNSIVPGCLLILGWVGHHTAL